MFLSAYVRGRGAKLLVTAVEIFILTLIIDLAILVIPSIISYIAPSNDPAEPFFESMAMLIAMVTFPAMTLVYILAFIGTGYYAKAKGYSPVPFLLLYLLFGWFVTGVLLLMPNIRQDS